MQHMSTTFHGDIKDSYKWGNSVNMYSLLGYRSDSSNHTVLYLLFLRLCAILLVPRCKGLCSYTFHSLQHRHTWVFPPLFTLRQSLSVEPSFMSMATVTNASTPLPSNNNKNSVSLASRPTNQRTNRQTSSTTTIQTKKDRKLAAAVTVLPEPRHQQTRPTRRCGPESYIRVLKLDRIRKDRRRHDVASAALSSSSRTNVL